MSKRTALFPGTFDPVTHGHVDLVRRGLVLFDRVVVGVVADQGKPLFPAADRVRLLEQMTAEGLGAGTDSADKAVMKAATAAEKYAYIGALCLAMGEDAESDEVEHAAPTPAPAPAERRAPAPSVAAKAGSARPQSSQGPQRAARTNGPAAPSDPGSLAAQLAAITAEAARDPQGATRRLEALCASTHLTSMPQTAKGRAWSGIRRAAAACGIEDPAAWFNRITTQEQQ